MVFPCHFFRVVAVKEGLFDAVVQHPDVRCAVETRDLLAESAFKLTVLERDDDIMVGGELAQQLFVQTGDEARIDNGRVDAGFFFEQRRRLFREGEERAETEDSDPCAAVGDMIGVQTAESFLTGSADGVSGPTGIRIATGYSFCSILQSSMARYSSLFVGAR